MKYDFTKDPEKKGDGAITVGRVRKRKLDLFPRLVCLLIALGVWIYMVNLNDTDATAKLTLKVEVIGAEELKNESNLLIYGLNKEKLTVNVTVKGTQRELRKYTEEDYKATVDVSKITGRGKQTIPVEIKSPSGSKITIEERDFENVTLYSDVSTKKNVAFYTVAGNMTTVPWYTYNIEQSEDFIELRGPASMLEVIDTARYIIDGEFYTSKDFSGFPLEFYDKNGDVVSFEDGMISYSTADMVVSVKVTTTAEIPVEVVVTGEGSHLIAKPEIEKITIIGDPTLIGPDKITKYVVTLSQAVVGVPRSSTISSQNESIPDGVTVKDEGKTFLIHFEEPIEENSLSDNASEK